MARIAALFPVTAALLCASPPAPAQDRGDTEDACRQYVQRRGYSNLRLEFLDFDRSRGGATMRGRMRSGHDDRFTFECRVDRDTRVRGFELTRQAGEGRPGDDDDRLGRREAERACVEEARRRGRHNADLDNVRFDRFRGGATLTGLLRSGHDDRFDFVCRIDDRGNVRSLSLTRAGGASGRDDDRRNPYLYLVGADRPRLESEMSQLGFVPVERGGPLGRQWGYWATPSTGICVATRAVGGRVAEVQVRPISECSALR